MDKRHMIASISSLDELDGYELQAKKRGISAEEVQAIHERREYLSKNLKHRKRRRG